LQYKRLTMLIRKFLGGLALAGTVGAAFNGVPAMAALSINLYESGSGVGASYSGSVNTNGLTPYASSSILGGIGASFGIAWGPSVTPGVAADLWCD
jgi:hypothetical protein